MSENEVKVQVDDYPTVATNVPGPGSYEPPPTYPGRTTTEPPTYSNDSPPDYDSIFGKVKRMKEESNGNVDFASKMVGPIICGTICSIITMIICLAIPIASIAIGAINLKNCPIERYIPIYLVVSGVFGIVKACFTGGMEIKKKKEDNADDDEQTKRPNPIDQIINCFLFAWFIAGSVWVYSHYGDVNYTDTNSDQYCDKTCYLFTFAIITMAYCFMALGLLCCCGICCIMCCMAGKE